MRGGTHCVSPHAARAGQPPRTAVLSVGATGPRNSESESLALALGSQTRLSAKPIPWCFSTPLPVPPSIFKHSVAGVDIVSCSHRRVTVTVISHRRVSSTQFSNRSGGCSSSSISSSISSSSSSSSNSSCSSSSTAINSARPCARRALYELAVAVRRRDSRFSQMHSCEQIHLLPGLLVCWLNCRRPNLGSRRSANPT